jgi:hypothetical protein
MKGSVPVGETLLTTDQDFNHLHGQFLDVASVDVAAI